MIETLHDQIHEALDETLIGLAQQEAYVKRAYQAFAVANEALHHEIDEVYFNEWLIHHYKENGVSASDQAHIKADEAAAINQAYLGFFLVKLDKTHFILEDIFTKKQFPISRTFYQGLVDETKLLFGHVYDIRGAYILSEECQTFDPDKKTLLIKHIMDQYDTVAKEKHYTLEGFITNVPLLLYGAACIMKDLASQDDEEYVVYEVACSITDQDLFKAFLGSEAFKKTLYDDVYEWFIEGEKVAEVVIANQMVLFEFADEWHTEEGLAVLAEAPNGLVVLETRLTQMDELFDSEPGTL